MSRINAKPFIITVLETLTREQANALLSLMDGSDHTPEIFTLIPGRANTLKSTDTGIRFCDVEINSAGSAQTVYQGYLIHNATHCVLISFPNTDSDNLVLLKIIRGSDGEWHHEFVDSGLTILELRFEVNDLISDSGAVVANPTGAATDDLIKIKVGKKIYDVGNRGFVAQADDTTTVDGWDVPELTAEQVSAAYNALVAGNSATIESEDGDLQFKAIMGDATTASPSILIPYYWLGWVDYQIGESDAVTITAHKAAETPAHQITSVTVGTDTIDITVS